MIRFKMDGLTKLRGDKLEEKLREIRKLRKTYFKKKENETCNPNNVRKIKINIIHEE